MKEELGSKHGILQGEELLDNPFTFKQLILTERAIKEESSFIENSIKSGSFYFERYNSSNYLQLCNPSSLLMQFFSKYSLFKHVRLSKPSIL
jgi:hypothetical protein